MKAQPAPSDPAQIAEHLTNNANNDTVYRDIYLERARVFITPILSPQKYDDLKRDRKMADDWARKARIAAEQSDWQQALELAAIVHAAKQKGEESEHLIAVAKEIYEPKMVVLDPFSPGLQAVPGTKKPETARNSLINDLMALENEDEVYRGFYSARRSFFASVSIGGEEPAPSAGEEKGPQLHDQAAQAAEHGDMETLERLVNALSSAPVGSPVPGEYKPSPEIPTNLLFPIPTNAKSKAAKFGMIAETLEPGAQALSDFFLRLGSQPLFQDNPSIREGGLKINPESWHLPAEMSQSIKEALDLFLLHPFVNSCGVRYLPRLTAEELLFEDFPENQERFQKNDLLDLLGLDRRRALSRFAIEQTLLRRGPAFIRDQLELDPLEWRLTCIPPDIYSRIGRNRGWGKQPLWTHFDGYQLMKDGGIRALVGGDVRYGGILDLCSISPYDERESVIVRFAVVRRERLMVNRPLRQQSS